MPACVRVVIEPHERHLRSITRTARLDGNADALTTGLALLGRHVAGLLTGCHDFSYLVEVGSIGGGWRVLKAGHVSAEPTAWRPAG